MTTTDPTISEIHRLIDSIDGRLAIIAAAIDALPATTADPLAEFRLPGGAVGMVEEAARWVQRGDWVQAVHGDEGRWEQVVGAVHASTQTGITTNNGTRTRLRWWGHDDKVRVATAPVPDPSPHREDLVDARHRRDNGGL